MQIATEFERQAVLEQLDRLLASSLLCTSKRLKGFLRHIVEQELENGGTELRERIIGVQAFGRPPGYDTNADPVVRVSAGDLRKRIAQYYYAPGHESELRIEIPTGTYRPVFHLPAAVAAPAADPAAKAGARPGLEISTPAIRRAPVHSAWRWPVAFATMAGLLAVLGAVAMMKATTAQQTAYEQFWEPVVAGEGPVLVYAGERQDGHLAFEDAVALADLSGDLRTRSKPYRILKASELSPELLKQGPSLLIGGLTNSQTRRLTQQLRFTFVGNDNSLAGGVAYIQDRQHPDSKKWSNQLAPLDDSPSFTDYAIISRVIDPVTDRIAVVAAGLRRYGNFGAAEFLSHPDRMEALTAMAPQDWRKKNMQAVLAVNVRDGKVAPASVVGADFW